MKFALMRNNNIREVLDCVIERGFKYEVQHGLKIHETPYDFGNATKTN
jgi:hypothetical protein